MDSPEWAKLIASKDVKPQGEEVERGTRIRKTARIPKLARGSKSQYFSATIPQLDLSDERILEMPIAWRSFTGERWAGVDSNH
jgi:hypothetical protein